MSRVNKKTEVDAWSCHWPAPLINFNTCSANRPFLGMPNRMFSVGASAAPPGSWTMCWKGDDMVLWVVDIVDWKGNLDNISS